MNLLDKQWWANRPIPLSAYDIKLASASYSISLSKDRIPLFGLCKMLAFHPLDLCSNNIQR